MKQAIKDVLKKYDKHLKAGSFGYDGGDSERHKQFIAYEIKKILEGLKGEKKDELQLSEKPEGFIGDYVKEMERRIGSNQREQKLREDIEEIIG